jgi:hypothetical protein
VLQAPETNVTYQWQVNGQAVSGATGINFDLSQAHDMDEVSCAVTQNSACGDPQLITTATNSFVVLTPNDAIPIPRPTYTKDWQGNYLLTANGLAPGGGYINLYGTAGQNIQAPAVNRNLSDLSCEFWVNPYSFTTRNVYFSMTSVAGNSVLVMRQLTPDSLEIEINAKRLIIPYSTPVNDWTHFELIKSRAIIWLFANGLPLQKLDIGVNVAVSCGSINIGANSANAADKNFNGNFDEFRLWEGAVSRATRLEWMYKEITTSHPDYSRLLSYFKFNTGNELNEEVSKQTATANPGFTPINSYYWQYLWNGSDAPATAIYDETLTIANAPTNQCAVYKVKAVAPDGRESPWSEELHISDMNTVIPAAGASGP